MKDIQKDLKHAIKNKYGTVEKWANKHEISSNRFYNFLNGEYNPTLKTLETWLSTVDLELATKKKR